MASNSPRKVATPKRVAPSTQQESQRLKSVTFSNNTVETSIGGTQRVGKIKQDLLLHFDTRSVANGSPRNLSTQNGTPRSGSSTRTSGSSEKEKENKYVKKSLQQTSLPLEAAPNDSSCQNVSICNTNSSKKDPSSHNLSVCNTNNSNSSAIKVIVSPLKEKSIVDDTTAQIINIRNNKSSLDKQDEESNKSKYTESESVQIKYDEKKSSVTKTLHPAPDDRRTTIEEIETVARSPFRTPDSKHARRHTLESKIFGTADCYQDVSFGTPRRMAPMIQDESIDVMEDGEDSCSITVAVRVRPFSQRELADSSTRCAISMLGNGTTVTSDNGSVHNFAYDFSFWSHDRNSAEFCDQENVYSRLAQPLLGKAFEGYNTCLFAYGQTGSGKSYSIMGHAKEPGIVPRFCEELFTRAENLTSKKKVKFNVEISFFEIYNEKIHDLLTSIKTKEVKKAVLKVREHPSLGPYVEGLSTYVVNSFDDVEGWITLGNKNRATAATGMNDKSSRSHSVFTIVLTQTRTESVEGQEHDHSVNSKINLVDLAGSERQSLANTTGERLREGANINKSLLTLGKVISLLSERSGSSKKRKIFIPYRDSVLTWLLKESLGGNSKTAMIAAVSPSNHHSEETLSTLRYAQQAQSIVNVTRINEDPKAKIIRRGCSTLAGIALDPACTQQLAVDNRICAKQSNPDSSATFAWFASGKRRKSELRAEIERLRADQGGMMNEEVLAVSMSEIARLKSEMEELGRSWQERLRQAEARKAAELQSLERSGITFKVNNTLPSLVNLNEDPQLSEVLLYVIKEGDTKVGREIDESQHDIKLTGALIADSHCVINSRDKVVKITPIRDAPTYINGILITQTTIIHHGDRVILGGDHYFRFNHPTEVQSKSDVRGSSEIKDFDFAKQELHRVQEARLQAELEEELEKTRKELSSQKDGYENKLKGLENVLTKVEETQREAETTISSLKQQNLILEQEVIAGRKRQKLESAASQKVFDETGLTKSRVVDLVKAETENVAKRLKMLRKGHLECPTRMHLANTNNNNNNASPVMLPSSPGARRSLYKISLLLREANRINQFLKTNLTFSREDRMQSELDDNVHTEIRVTNARHRMYTLWSISKFEEKLSQMRDLYQNGGGTSTDDDEVFNDPEDVWEKEASVSSPGGRQGSWKSSAKADSLPGASSKNLRRVSGTFASSWSGQDVEMSMIRACKGLLATVGDSLTALNFEESLVDKVLSVCQRIGSSSAAIAQLDIKISDSVTNEKSWSRPMLQLVADVHLLASHTTLWSSFYDELQPVLRDLLPRSTAQVKAIAHQASSLFQGCEGRLTSLITESVHKLTSATRCLCEICGELSLTIDTSVLRLEQSARDRQSQLSPDICQSFLTGCSHFVARVIKGGIVSIENCNSKCLGWVENKEKEKLSLEISKRLSHVLSCLQDLLSKTQQVQRELDQGASYGRSPHYYIVTYKRLQAVTASVSAIVDSCTLLLEFAESIHLGASQDSKRLERCAELIQKSLQQLLSASSFSYSQTSATSSALSSSPSFLEAQTSSLSSSSSSSTSRGPTSSSSSSSLSSQSDMYLSSNMVTSSDVTTDSELTDVTLLSESQINQIESAVQEASVAVSLFIEHVCKSMNTCQEMTRAKLASPEKSIMTPAMHTARLKRQNIKQTVNLASLDS